MQLAKNCLPAHAPHVIAVSLSVAVRIAIVEVQVEGVSRASLGSRPVVVGNDILLLHFSFPVRQSISWGLSENLVYPTSSPRRRGSTPTNECGFPVKLGMTRT